MLRIADMNDLEVLVELFIEENHHNHKLAPDVVARTEDVLSTSKPQEIMDDENTYLYVCESDGDVTGLLLGNIVYIKAKRWSQARRFAGIEELIVTERARGKGFAKALVSQFEAWAKVKGARSIELHVWTNNDIAINFYETSGYLGKQLLMSKPVQTPANLNTG